MSLQHNVCKLCTFEGSARQITKHMRRAHGVMKWPHGKGKELFNRWAPFTRKHGRKAGGSGQ